MRECDLAPLRNLAGNPSSCSVSLRSLKWPRALFLVIPRHLPSNIGVSDAGNHGPGKQHLKAGPAVFFNWQKIAWGAVWNRPCSQYVKRESRIENDSVTGVQIRWFFGSYRYCFHVTLATCFLGSKVGQRWWVRRWWGDCRSKLIPFEAKLLPWCPQVALPQLPIFGVFTFITWRLFFNIYENSC